MKNCGEGGGIMKKLVTDLDGTLLNSKHLISRKNVEALHDLFQKNGEVIIATGRPFFEVEHILIEIGKSCPVISLNGAIVYDEHGKIMHSCEIDNDCVARLIKMLLGKNLNYDIVTNQGVYKVGDFERLKQIYHSSRHSIDFSILEYGEREGYVHFMTEHDFFYLLTEGIFEVYKITVYSDEADFLQYLASLMREAEDIEISSSLEVNLEVSAMGVSKGLALQYLAEHYGCGLEDFISVGDSLNDLSMLKVCGFPVAMANADKEVKSVAQLITSSNNEHGIAEVIKREILH